MRLCLSVAGFALSIAAASAEQLPRPVKAAIAESKTSCRTVRFQPGFIARPDVNGDGRPDYVLDYTFARCDGDPRGFCGSLGCSTQVFASLPDGTYAKVVDETLRRLIFRRIDGRPAAVLGYAGDAEPCRGDPTDVCDVVKIWNGSTFEAPDHVGSAPAAPAQQKTPLAASAGESREAAAGTGLNSATVRVGVYCCTGVGPADLHSNVLAGVAPKFFPEGSLVQTTAPFFIIPVSISVDADRIVLNYPKGGMFGSAPFNGYHFVFSGVAPITSVRLDPASTFRPRGVRFTSNSVEVNVSGQRTGRGTEAIVDIFQSSSPQATAANDASDPSSVVGAVVALDTAGDGKAFGIRRVHPPLLHARVQGVMGPRHGPAGRCPRRRSDHRRPGAEVGEAGGGPGRGQNTAVGERGRQTRGDAARRRDLFPSRDLHAQARRAGVENRRHQRSGGRKPAGIFQEKLRPVTVHPRASLPQARAAIARAPRR